MGGEKAIFANSDSWYQGYDVSLAKVLGDINSAILYQYLNYWCKKSAEEYPDADGFCWRTTDQIYKDTGMTKFQSRRAAQVLEENGLLEQKKAYIPGRTVSCMHYKTLSRNCQVTKNEEVKKLNFLGSKETSLPLYNTYINTEKIKEGSSLLSSVSTQNAESTASDRELSAPSPFEAPNTKRADEVNETPETNAPSSTSQSPAESENKLNNEEFAKKVYNRVQARLRRATATARKVGNTERMQYFADQLRLWRKPDKRSTILSRIQWLLDADIYTQGQIENVLMDTVNGYYMRKEVNESGEEVEISVPNDLVRVLTQSDQDQMLWQLDKNFKITDEVIDELLGGEDDGEETC